jgi:hypothetical protein
MLAKQHWKIDVSTPERQAHWQNVYQTKSERDVSGICRLRAIGDARRAQVPTFNNG